MPAKNEAPAAAEAADKTAADLLIEMQLEKERQAAINPMVVIETTEVSAKDKNEAGVSVVARTVYANGTVLESYA